MVVIEEQLDREAYEISGKLPLVITLGLFLRWLFGRGKDRVFGNFSPISAKLRHSGIMQGVINRAIEEYDPEKPTVKSSVLFTKAEPDLWLSVRRAPYTLGVQKELRTRRGQQQSRFRVRVRLWDTYNFNIGNESGDGVGSFLNNLGYWLEKRRLGRDYTWVVYYVYRTPWKTN